MTTVNVLLPVKEISGVIAIKSETNRSKMEDAMKGKKNLRIVELRWNVNKTTKAPAIHVPVIFIAPSVTITAVPAELSKFCQDKFDSAQDEIYRAHLTTVIKAGRSNLVDYTFDTSIANVEKIIAENATGGKISSDKIEEWYSDVLADIILNDRMVAACKKYSCDAEELDEVTLSKIDYIVDQYKSNFGKLTSKDTSIWSEPVLDKLCSVLDLLDEKEKMESVPTYIVNKIKSLRQPKKIELAMIEDSLD
jgi:hypothetical protein